MSEAQHTPGEWRSVRGDDFVFVEAVNVAHVGVVNGDAYAAPFVIQAKPRSSGSPEANARLIAFAPDLLTALQEQVGRCLDPNCELCAEHEQLIAKATGTPIPE